MSIESNKLMNLADGKVLYDDLRARVDQKSGAKPIVFALDNISNTSGSYSHTTTVAAATATMKPIALEVSNPAAFLGNITVTCANGSITLSCPSVEGTSTVSVTVEELAQNAGQSMLTSEEFAVLDGRIGTLSSLNTTEKGSVVGAVNEITTDLGTLSNAIHVKTPEEFGAKGDGITDDSQAVQDACDAGYAVYFGSNKTYYLASPVNIEHDCHLFGGENTVIKTKTPTGGVVNDAFVVSGTLKKTTTLTSDYKSNGNSDNCNNKFTFSDMDGISVGDVMVITATDQYYHYAREYYYLGSSLLITDIFDNHIYSCDSMPWDIENTEDVSVSIYNAPVAIIENLHFVSDLDSIGQYKYFIRFDRCKNSIIKNCDMTQMANGIRINECVNVNISNVSLSKSKYDNAGVNDAYGIFIDSCSNTIIERVLATCAQHSITVSGYIPSMNTLIRNCNLTSECRAPGLDTHESTYNLVIEDTILGTAALNGTVRINRCKIINNRRVSSSDMDISIYGSHNPSWSKIRIENTDFDNTGIIMLDSAIQNPIQPYNNVFGNIEIVNCTGGTISYDPSTNATILSNTINNLTISNCKNFKEIYHTGEGKIKLLSIIDSDFTAKYFINNHNSQFYIGNIDYIDMSHNYPMVHKISVSRDTYGENVVLPEGLSINLTSNNNSAKFIVCGANLVSDDADDYFVGSVGGSSGGTLTRTPVSGTGYPSISIDENGDLVYSQASAGTSSFCFYPVGMFYVKENSIIKMDTTVVNSGNTTGSTFRPVIAIVDCATGKLEDRYFGTAVQATAQGADSSFNYSASANTVVLCYYYCSNAISGAETTFRNRTVKCEAFFAHSVLLDNEKYIAKRLTGNGTLTSIDGVNNIMCSELVFHVNVQADLVNNPIGLLPNGTGVSF